MKIERERECEIREEEESGNKKSWRGGEREQTRKMKGGDGGPLTGGPFSYQVFVIGPRGHVVGPLRPPPFPLLYKDKVMPPRGRDDDDEI